MQPASSLDLSSHFLNTAELSELPLGFGSSLTLSFPFFCEDNGDGGGEGT